MPANRYYVCYSYAPDPAEIDIAGPADGIPEYNREVLRVFEREMAGAGLTVYVTWKVDELPTTGRNVVAMVMGDEWSRTPLYAQDVLATFKMYGGVPQLGYPVFERPSWIKALLAAKYARALAHGARGRLRRAARRLRGPVPPIVPIPLGYGNQLDLPVRPLGDRRVDVFFAGSVEHGRPSRISPRYWLRSPKTLAREEMVAALDRLRAARPDLEIRTTTTPSFTLNALYYGTEDGAGALDARAYSEAMMDARICLVPRGTSPETFRYFEALRYGCIAVAERQPDFPFYRGAPVVEVSDWSRGDTVLAQLLADPSRMERLHAAGPAWWAEHCSAERVGVDMARTVEAELGGTRASSGRPAA